MIGTDILNHVEYRVMVNSENDELAERYGLLRVAVACAVVKGSAKLAAFSELCPPANILCRPTHFRAKASAIPSYPINPIFILLLFSF